MKRIFLLVVMFLAIAPTSLWAVGTCTQAVTDTWISNQGVTTRSLTFVCTADVAAATYPSTAVSTANMELISGWILLMGSTLNGATAPTNLYDITLTDALGVDVLGTAGNNRPGTAGVSSQFVPITDTTYVTGGMRPITSTLTMDITNNAVNSAVTTVTFFFVK